MPPAWRDYGQPRVQHIHAAQAHLPQPSNEPGLLASPIPPTLNDPRPRRPKAQPRAPVWDPRAGGYLSMATTIVRRDHLATHQSPYAPNHYPMPMPELTRPRARFGVIPHQAIQDASTWVIARNMYRRMGRFDYYKFQWALGRCPCMHWTTTEGPRQGHCYNYRTNILRPESYRGQIITCASGNNCKSLLDWQIRDLAHIPGTERMWICEAHVSIRRDDDIMQCHRVGTCSVCRRRERRNHPGEFSSCNCEEILPLHRKFCQQCYTERHQRLVNNFRHRVNRPPWHGRANRAITGATLLGAPIMTPYWQDPPGLQAIREMLVDRHPCGLGCGRDRENQTEVMDCRSCGGLITEPMAHNGRQRSIAQICKDKNTLLALDDNGIPVITQEVSSRAGRRTRSGLGGGATVIAQAPGGRSTRSGRGRGASVITQAPGGRVSRRGRSGRGGGV